jgi:hypothetical protein
MMGEPQSAITNEVRRIATRRKVKVLDLFLSKRQKKVAFACSVFSFTLPWY